MSEVVRVVCVEDHPVVRGGLRALLDSVPDLDLVGEAATLAEAREVIADLQPDVVLLDVELPDGDGVTALPELLKAAPDARVLVLTMHEEPHLVSAALRAGARGWVLKESDPDDLVRAVQAVASGQSVLGAGVAPGLLGSAVPDGPLGRLTPRERQVLELVARGQGNERIAAALGLSAKTVANLVSALLTKLNARDRAHAVALAREANLGGTRPGGG